MRTKRLGTLTALLALLFTLFGPPAPASAQECGCRDTGEYEAAATRAPAAQELSPNGGTYRLVTSQTATEVTLRLEVAATGALVEAFFLPLNRVAWGFSPDGDRFAYRHASATHMDDIVLYDLAADRRVHYASVTSGAAMAFSPHGRWFFTSVLDGPGQSHLTVVDSVSGTVALNEFIAFETIPGDPGDRFGVIGTGFSSEDADRSFVWAYRQIGGSIVLKLRNLETRTTVLSRPVGGAWWRFSPCGDALGLVNQTTGDAVTVRIYKTSAPNLSIGTEKTFSPIPAHIKLDTTLDHHRVTTTNASGQQTVTNIGANTADDTCPTPVALSSVSVAPATVVGGEANATGTVELSGNAPSSLSVSLASSDPSAASVPSSVTVLSGTKTKSFSVTSRQVSAPRTVTITATAAGVSRTATLTVNPPAQTGPSVADLTVDNARPLGGGTVTATVTLDGPAATGGTAVALQSSVPSVASVPASATVAAGATTATFPISTRTVDGDSPAVITATAGGASRTVRLTVLTADRTCQQGSSDPVTGTLKARSFGAYDDAGSNVDCVVNSEFDTGITVGPGTTGLAPGDPVQLIINLRFDGGLHTSPPLGSGGSLAEGVSQYWIIDDSVPPDGEGIPEAVNFDARFTLQQYKLDPGYPNVYWDTRARLATNAGEPQENYDWSEHASADAAGGSRDTGNLTAVYTTTVGAHLSVHGRVSTVASAYGPGASAVANFSNTFQAHTSPAPGFEGLALVRDGEVPPNQAPSCSPGEGTTTEGTALAAGLSCTDPDGDPLSYAVTAGPANGTLSAIAPDGSFTYTPAAGFTGTDSFTFAASDGQATSATETYTVTVTRLVVGPPLTADECKDGGWQRFNNPAFPNQGQCVKYVNTGR
jgi:hypothetical protein